MTKAMWVWECSCECRSFQSLSVALWRLLWQLLCVEECYQDLRLSLFADGQMWPLSCTATASQYQLFQCRRIP